MNQEVFNNYVAVALRAAREKAGVSQTNMAELLGVKQSSVAGFENGAGALSTETLRKYSQALGLDVTISFIKRKRKQKEKPLPEEEAPASLEDCSRCYGTGWAEPSSLSKGSKLSVKVTCPRCSGSGKQESGSPGVC